MTSLADRWNRNLRRSRVMLGCLLLPLAVGSFAETADSVLRLVYIVLGFSLIIFLHELGHFVVARLCSVKCLAFSIGIGPRMLGWRKGTKVTFGNDPYDPETRNKSKKTDAHDELQKVEANTTHSDLPTTAVEPPHPATVGDCDYRVSWLPLGGYVRMLGQDDMDPTKVSQDPHAFNQRPIWQRMCIVSAGVTMNIIFALVAFSIIFSVGIDFPPAIVGGTEYNFPAEKAGLRMGDRIVSINGVKPTGFVEFTDVQIAAALASRGENISIAYLRPGVEGVQTVTLVPADPPEGGFLRFGVVQMPSLRIVRSKSVLEDAIAVRGKSEAEGGNDDAESVPELKRLKPKDEIIAIDGRPVHDDPAKMTPGYVALYNYLQGHGAAEPVKLTVQDAQGGNKRDIMLRPRLERKANSLAYPEIWGMSPRLMIKDVVKGGVADKAGLKAGDIIVRIGNRSWPSEEKFRSIVAENPGQTLDVEVLRNGEDKTIAVTPASKDGKGRMDLYPGPSLHDTIIALSDRSAAIPGVNDMDSVRIAAIDGTPVKTWDEIYDLLKRHNGDSVTLSFAPAGNKPSAVASADGATPPATAPAAAPLDAAAIAALPHATFTLDPALAESLRTQMHYVLNIPVENYMEPQLAKSPGQAVIMGAEHTKKFIQQVYMTLAGLARRTVSPDNLHGIVGITKIGYDVQERGPIWLWYVLAMVSVNLAVANFLPLPIVDGGLFLLLILEKIRGKPLSLKVQSAIQVVGIVLLGGLFLFVTYNDLHLFVK